MVPEGLTIARQRRDRAKRKFEAQEIMPLKGLLSGANVSKRSRPRWMIPGSDSDDILILQEGEVLATDKPRCAEARVSAEEDEALTLDELLQKGAASVPAGLHKKKRRRAMIEVLGEAVVTKHLKYRPPIRKSSVKGKARVRAKSLASVARTHCGSLQS